MSSRLTHVLHRLTSLKHRFEQERHSSAPSPMRLLKLRSVILRAEQHLQRLAAAHMGANRGLRPVMATGLSLRTRG